MKRLIPVLDSLSGRTLQRECDTPTLDIPKDFDREAGVASLDDKSNGHYRSVGGETLVYAAATRPLSWRIQGEQCLVAKSRHTAASTDYRLSIIDLREQPRRA